MKTTLARNIMMVLLVFLMGLSGTLYYVLFKMDTSSLPIDPASIPEVTGVPYAHRHPVILVNYAHGPSVFFKNQNSLNQSALGKGIDIIASYRRGHLDPAFYEKNKAILDQKIGGGYWLWKPYIILKTMKMYPENTVIVYADSGAVFSQPLAPLFAFLEKTPLVLAENGQAVPVRNHLKMEARQALGISKDDPRLNASKMWAFFLIVKNTPEARAFIEEWLHLCEVKDALTNEPFDPTLQEKDFGMHLHDESMLSLVAATHPELTTIIPKNILRKKYGVHNFHRQPHEEYLSPLFTSAGVPSWLSTFLFNNILAQKIRKNLM